MILVRWIALISFVMRQRCFPHIGMFSFLHRECINLHEGHLRNKMHLHSTLKGCLFVLKDFCYMEDGWKVKMNICTALWSFVNFCCLSQSKVSTDNRKVSIFLAFQHVRCRCCYRSYLRRGSTQVSTVLRKSARVFMINVFLIWKTSPSWNREMK